MPTRSKLLSSAISETQHGDITERDQAQRQVKRRQKVSNARPEAKDNAALEERPSTAVSRQEQGHTAAGGKTGGRKGASRQTAGEDVKTEPVNERDSLNSTVTPTAKRKREKGNKEGTESSFTTPKIKRQRQSAKQENVSPTTELQPKSTTISEEDNLSTKLKVKHEEQADTVKQLDTLSPPPKTKRSRKVQDDKAEAEDELKPLPKSPKKRQRKSKDAVDGEASSTDVKPKIKRKTKEEKEAEKMPLAQRTVGHKMYIGAHVSASGGVHKAVMNSVHIGGNAFALFLKSQRKWANPPLAEEVASQFHEGCKTHTYDAGKHVVPHGSYLVNLAAVDPVRTKQAYDSFLDDLQRCERLGIKLYNFHPGNTNGKDRATAIKHLAGNINRAHKETKTVVTLLENMAAGGNIIGTTFEDLRDTIDHIDDKSRVGVCFDTCHAFAAGYDLRSPEAFKATLEQFDKVVGLKYLRALHMNDSKGPLGCHRDLHAQIGTGYLGLRAFHNIINEPHFMGLPMVLETPITVTDEDGEPLKNDKGEVREEAGSWVREIKLLESLWEMDAESEEFLSLEASLARKGIKERVRIGDQAERRKVKDAKKAAKGKKRKAGEEDEEDSDVE